MAQVADKQLRQMIANIPDPNVRAHYEAQLTGATKIVKCLSKKCGGKSIGELNALGAWNDISRSKKYGLRSTRQRLDGHTGFACRCGNYSILAEAEKGNISGRIPNKSDLSKIYIKVKNNPTKITLQNDGTIIIDGFAIVPIKAGA